MEEFKELENLWKQSKTEVPTEKKDLSKLQNNRTKMKNSNIKGAVLLIITGILILVMMFLLDLKIKNALVTFAIVIMSAICFIQAAIMLFTAREISKIDETQTPTLHLKQWQNFRELQKRQRVWNMPVYYVLLSTALGIYMYELLKTVDLWKMILAFGVTYAWILFAYFYLGKKKIRKDDERLNGIISDLKQLEQQFQ